MSYIKHKILVLQETANIQRNSYTGLDLFNSKQENRKPPGVKGGSNKNIGYVAFYETLIINIIS